MMDVNYFLDQAQNSTQKEFELDWADVIHVFDTDETHLTTECGRTLIIYWLPDGRFGNYEVIYETPQMESSFKRDVVLEIIEKLQTIDVDGETMQYIIEKVGMTDQMLRQLVMSADMDDVFCLVEERNML